MSQLSRPCVHIRVEKYLMTKGLLCLLGVGWSYYSPADVLLSGDDSGNLIDMPEPYNISKFLRQCLRVREVTNPPGKLPLPPMFFSSSSQSWTVGCLQQPKLFFTQCSWLPIILVAISVGAQLAISDPRSF